MSHPPDGPPGALSPEEWGARIDYDAWHDVYVPKDGVAEHHGGGSDYPAGRLPVDAFSQAREIKQLRDWESFHLSKGWRGLAYGYGIGQTGTIYRIRGWHTYGAHTGDVDGDGIANNKEIVPYIFIGSGHHHRKSQAAMDAIVRLRRFIELHSPKATYLWGHQELKGTATSCPGPFGMEYVRANRVLPKEEDMPLTDDDVKRVADAVWFKLFTDPVAGNQRGIAHHVVQGYKRSDDAARLGAQILAAIQSVVPGSPEAVADEIARRLAE